MKWRRQLHKWGNKARDNYLGHESIHYSLWHLTLFTLRLFCVPKHHASFQHCSVWWLNSPSSCQETNGPEWRVRFKTRVSCLWLGGIQEINLKSLSILMKIMCVFRNTFPIICCDRFCHWLPSGIWRRCILLSHTGNVVSSLSVIALTHILCNCVIV